MRRIALCLAWSLVLLPAAGCSDDSLPAVSDSGADQNVKDQAVTEGGAKDDSLVPDGASADVLADQSSSPDLGADAGPDAACPDSDKDTICDAQDVCPGEDDRVDIDTNSVPDCKENLLDNGQFVSDVSKWMAESGSTITFSSTDAQGVSTSGSAELVFSKVATVSSVVGSSQCVAVQAGTQYLLYAQVQVIDPNNKGYAGSMNVKWYDGANCTGGNAGVDNFQKWYDKTWTLNSYEVTGKGVSARVRLNVNKAANSGVAQVNYDNVLMRVK